MRCNTGSEHNMGVTFSTSPEHEAAIRMESYTSNKSVERIRPPLGGYKAICAPDSGVHDFGRLSAV